MLRGQKAAIVMSFAVGVGLGVAVRQYVMEKMRQSLLWPLGLEELDEHGLFSVLLVLLIALVSTIPATLIVGLAKSSSDDNSPSGDGEVG